MRGGEGRRRDDGGVERRTGASGAVGGMRAGKGETGAAKGSAEGVRGAGGLIPIVSASGTTDAVARARTAVTSCSRVLS